ncbi:uncharacterized protein LOC123266977 [Cotesia glomerata]|uniref:Uncharacterized protein n=1 Tax=Cotesia glomerata TaxID=32391 RepID=A0AAV7HUE8_COTGL|nr:uncharacterized protein LOC123266977 [Cotesia glomerata]KAH0535785.1 hypothetical protein KQX54_019166 [Cotesia glomerata]
MKGFIAIFVVILASAYLQVSAGQEMCPPENCLKAEACEEPVRSTSIFCTNGLTCCSIVKNEFQNLCHHSGGECMSSCNPRISIHPEKAKDCKSNEVCCVLVQ